MMTKRIGSLWQYDPALYDLALPCTDLRTGEIVRVCHPRGCPRPGTMGHYHVERMTAEGVWKFAGLVQGASLIPVAR